MNLLPKRLLEKISLRKDKCIAFFPNFKIYFILLLANVILFTVLAIVLDYSKLYIIVTYNVIQFLIEVYWESNSLLFYKNKLVFMHQFKRKAKFKTVRYYDISNYKFERGAYFSYIQINYKGSRKPLKIHSVLSRADVKSISNYFESINIPEGY